MSVKIYLIGSAPKSDEALRNFDDWRVSYLAELKKALNDVEMLDFNAVNESIGPLNLFGHDCHLVQTADLIIANAETKIGAGTAMEMIIAKYFQKPLITVLPKNTHHRKSNIVSGGVTIEDWIHPFIHSISDEIADTIETAVALAKQYLLTQQKAKDITIIDEAIEKYLDFVKNK